MSFGNNIKIISTKYLGNNKKEIHFNIYILFLTLLVIGLPVSRFLMSVSMFGLSINWLLEGRVKQKMGVLFARKSLILLLSVYLLHVAGLFYSSDLAYGIHDLKVKLPFLIIILIVGTSDELTALQLKTILKFFILSVFVATLISSVVFMVMHSALQDQRDISLFISHIRFSLMVVFSVLIIFYALLFNGYPINKTERKILILLAVWLSVFIFILQSFTGIWIYIASVSVLMIIYVARQRKFVITATISLILLALIVFISSLIFKAFSNFYPPPDPDIEKLEKYTLNKNPYYHNTESKLIENGQYIYLYLCVEEVKREWNKRSNISFDSLDNKGQQLSQTLIRYMTSRGLRKDSAGIAALSPFDIKMIENGIANYIFSRKTSIYPRIYQFFWELDVYRKTGNSGGHSLAQRIEFQRNGVEIIKRNFWFGVGTGDVKLEFDRQYRHSDSALGEKWRLRAHNQFITFLITFGFIGFLWIIGCFVFVVYYERNHINLLTMMFLLVAFLSMLNEDTLETMAGIVFFTVFFALFVFASKPEKDAAR